MTVEAHTGEVALPQAWPTWDEVYPGSGRGDAYFFKPDWVPPVQFLVGRNGSGKTRTGRALVKRLRESGRSAHYLSADRLSGITSYTYTASGAGYHPNEYRGAGTDEMSTRYAREDAENWGTANDTLHILREQPDAFLRLAALLQRAFGRRVRMAEQSGFLDPVVQFKGGTYSLLRDEGHGLRELVILLTAVYRSDWDFILVDEPELHLHPSLTQIWLQELQAECRASGKRAFVITHEPRLITPTTWEDLSSIWVTQPQLEPIRLGASVSTTRRPDVRRSLSENPRLVGDLVFSPRPVLVEGVGDVIAFTTVAGEIAAPEAVAQTDFIPCGGKSKIPLWLSIAEDVGLDVRVVADLDALFDPRIQRSIEASDAMRQVFLDDLHLDPPSVSAALKPIRDALSRITQGATSDTEKARLAAALDPTGAAAKRLDFILRSCRDAGFWFHSKGTIEDALGMGSHAETVELLRAEAAVSRALDDVVTWATYRPDVSVELLDLLNLEVERIGAELLAELRFSPTSELSAPVGQNAESDKRLVDVSHVGGGRHRITVLAPAQFAGYWLEVDRSKAVSTWELTPPSAPVDPLGESAATGSAGGPPA